MSRIFVAAALLAWAAGCSSTPASARTDGSSPADGLITDWAATKATCGTYSYLRVFRSVFGWSQETSVEITGDVPTRRHFLATSPGATRSSPPVTTQEWDERGAEVGTHTGAGAYPAETVEGLLAECAMILAGDPSRVTFTLTLDDRGFPRVCIETEKNAADDTSMGIWIEKFACAPLDASGAVVDPGIDPGDAAAP